MGQHNASERDRRSSLAAALVMMCIALLQELLDWSAQPQFVYQHQWRANDLVMWDNSSCLHRGRPWDNGTYKRVMHRTTLADDEVEV